MSRSPMRLSLSLKIAVALATMAPLAATLIPGVFMALVASGLLGHITPDSVPQMLESAAWSAVLALGIASASLHVALLAFYVCHIITNHSAPGTMRILFALSLLIVPLLAMPAYCCIYILPQEPPSWALQSFRRNGEAA